MLQKLKYVENVDEKLVWWFQDTTKLAQNRDPTARF